MLLEAHYAEAVPMHLFKEEQTRISREIAQAEAVLGAHSLRFDEIAKAIEDALGRITDAQATYMASGEHQRRLLNQAIFDRIWVFDDYVIGGDIAEPISDLIADDLEERLIAEAAELAGTRQHPYQRAGTPSRRERPHGLMPWETKNHDRFHGRGSSKTVLVALSGQSWNR